MFILGGLCVSPPPLFYKLIVWNYKTQDIFEQNFELGSCCVTLGYTSNRYGLNLTGIILPAGFQRELTVWHTIRIDNSVWEIENAIGSDQWAPCLVWAIPVPCVGLERGTSLAQFKDAFKIYYHHKIRIWSWMFCTMVKTLDYLEYL